MLLYSLSLITIFISVALSSKLYISSYDGQIYTFSLTKESAYNTKNNTYALTQTSSINATASSPAWLTLDSDSHTLFSVCENVPGSIGTYSISTSGQLTETSATDTVREPVHATLYNNGAAMVAAHYGGSSVTTYALDSKSRLTSIQNFTYPGLPTSHPHQAVLDPTGSFILVPDLGSDLLRLFSIDCDTSLITALDPVAVSTGTGPRHASFLRTHDTSYVFVLNELANTLSSFLVRYPFKGNITLSHIQTQSIFGGNTTYPTIGAGEIAMSPDRRYLITSSRGDNYFNITNPASTTVTMAQIPSDTLSIWKIDWQSGKLQHEQLTAAGGRFPRMFAMNTAGDLVAVGLQSDGRVVIIKRDIGSGRLGEFVAAVEGLGGVNSIVWDEL